MNAIPYLFWSESRLKLMQERMVANIATWHERWLKAGNDMFSEAVALGTRSGIPSSSKSELWTLENGERRLACVSFGVGVSFELLFLKMIDAPARAKRLRQGSAVASAIGQSLLADLVEAFVDFKSAAESKPAWRRLGTDDGRDVAMPSMLTLSISGNGVDLLLSFPSDAIAGLLPKPAPQPRPVLNPLLQGTHAASVPLRVSLEASEHLTLEAVENLAVGDILMLDQGINKTWTVAGPDGVVLAACTPGRVGTRYAVQILGPS